MLVSDLNHFLDLPDGVPGPARRLAQLFANIAWAATAGGTGDPWMSALPCRRRPGRRPCPGADHHRAARTAGTDPVWCSVCADEGVISNWERTRLVTCAARRLTVPGAVNEVVIADEVAAALRELVLLDPDCALPQLDITRVQRWCAARVPEHATKCASNATSPHDT